MATRGTNVASPLTTVDLPPLPPPSPPLGPVQFPEAARRKIIP